MATHATRNRSTGDRRTQYYFAYGSNLHLKQMKRRCPNSKYIGYARLANYRWQINERGYANIIETDGHWVDGLVYEIDDRDEVKLDINEGVSKNAYAKRYMIVQLHRAQSALYRRPTAWIVSKGGPAKVCRLTLGTQTPKTPNQHWNQEVLVYISLNYIEDSTPKEEYVSRINLGLADAKVLGIETDYINNCIRPFIPEGLKNQEECSECEMGQPTAKLTTKGVKRGASPGSAERLQSRKGQTSSRPKDQVPLRAPNTTRGGNHPGGTGPTVVFEEMAPPWPPRPLEEVFVTRGD